MAILLFVNLKGGVAKTAIDCPPNFPSQVRVWLSVGTGCIVPSVSDRLSVRGSRSLLDRIRTQGFNLLDAAEYKHVVLVLIFRQPWN